MLNCRPKGLPGPKNCCMSGMPSAPPCCCALGFDATVTFTTAGVTRAASVSMARSSVSNAATLLSSSGAAAGAGAAAAVADLVKLNIATDPIATTATKATSRRLVTAALQRALQPSIHIFIFFSPCTTKYLVVVYKKIWPLNRIRDRHSRQPLADLSHPRHAPHLHAPH